MVLLHRLQQAAHIVVDHIEADRIVVGRIVAERTELGQKRRIEEYFEVSHRLGCHKLHWNFPQLQVSHFRCNFAASSILIFFVPKGRFKPVEKTQNISL